MMTLIPSNPKPISDSGESRNASESPIWRIKYRSTKIEEIREFYPDVYNLFKGYIEKRNFPHLLLVGPKGAGKSVLAEILAHEILGDEFDYNFKLLFADDPISKKEREDASSEHISTKRIGSGAGINRRHRPFIQSRVRPFVATQKFGKAPYKILCVKNFHTLDVDQQAFRRIMEQYSSNCRMILITDCVSGIIDPILSRCQVVLVPYLKEAMFNKLIKTYCDREEVDIKLDCINAARFICKNNIGKVLDLLQLTKLQKKILTIETVTSMDMKQQTLSARDLLIKTMDGNIKAVRTTLRSIFSEHALSKTEILTDLSQLITELPIPRSIREVYLDMVAQADFQALDSTDDEIQLEDLLCKMALISSEYK